MSDGLVLLPFLANTLQLAELAMPQLECFLDAISYGRRVHLDAAMIVDSVEKALELSPSKLMPSHRVQAVNGNACLGRR